MEIQTSTVINTAAANNADNEPREVRSYREADIARIATHPVVRELCAAALCILARDGVRRNGAGPEGETVFDYTGQCANGAKLEIICRADTLPRHIPAETLRPMDVAANVKWRAQARLIVRAPILAFDIAWREGEPLRIMTFSRGTWEAEVLREAETRAAADGR